MNSTKKNFLNNLVYQMLLILLPLITAPYISRVLGPENIGKYSYTYSIAIYFALFAKLGFDNYGNRTIARSSKESDTLSKTFSGIFYLQMVLGIFVFILYLIYSFLFSGNTILSLIQGFWVLSTIFDLNWFFFGLENFTLVIIRNSLVKIVTVIFIFLFVRRTGDLFTYALIMSAGSLVGFISTWPFVFKKVNLTKINIPIILSHFYPTLKLFIPVIAISFFTIMDKIMLGNISSFNQVGFFESAEKVLLAPKGVIGALGTVMLPKMAKIYSSRSESNKNNMSVSSISFVLVFGIGCLGGIISVSNVFVPVFFGEKYLSAIPVLSVMALSLPFYAVGNVVRTQLLIPNLKDGPYIVSVVLGALVNLTVNFFLIPLYGALGAGIATLCAEVCISLTQMVYVKSEIQFSKFLPLISNCIVSSIFMAIIIRIISFYLNVRLLTLIIQIFVGVVFYCGIFILISILSKDKYSINLLKQIGIAKSKK